MTIKIRLDDFDYLNFCCVFYTTNVVSGSRNPFMIIAFMCLFAVKHQYNEINYEI